ncbi:hypothetical protein HPP92_024393 [Vanilla planifolia]|uniref:WRKY domain-containing protein n=1 Tax=Vanilla planifolia TaxID=51239 RepID=A0A835PMA9_VANPL|nr:hypothetical protein HPP92_024393 [Vanilla planifolia]
MENFYPPLSPPNHSTPSPSFSTLHAPPQFFSNGHLHASSSHHGLPAAKHVEEPQTSGLTGKKKKKEPEPRFAFQTRSQVDVLDDGYRWRKYGQKAMKNSRFPRCTHKGCDVKKQVQRLSNDEEFVVTTYKGTHNHPINKSTESFEHILGQMQVYSN